MIGTLSTLQQDTKMKTCNRCDEEKPLTEYAISPAHKGGYHTICKECKKDYARKGSYGLIVDDIEEIRKAQNGECAICHISTEDLHVDHCHGTNEVRGLLCKQCNMGIGLLKDSPKALREAALYIEAFHIPYLKAV